MEKNVICYNCKNLVLENEAVQKETNIKDEQGINTFDWLCLSCQKKIQQRNNLLVLGGALVLIIISIAMIVLGGSNS